MLNLIDVITNNYFLKQKLKVTIPKTPVRRLTDSWQGSTKSGKKILINPIYTKTIQDFNKFNFIRDLKSEGSIKARSTARSLVENWINEDYNLRSHEYNSVIMAERISCWSFNYSWFAESGGLDFQKKILNSIALQSKFLELKLDLSNDNLEKIIIIKGILVSKSVLYETIDNINQLLTVINEKLDILTNTDGGHISRSPVKQLNLLRHLIEIRSIIAILKNVDADRAGENMKRYASQILNDSLRQFDATLNFNKANDAGLTFVKYFGDVIPTTREICRDLINGVLNRRPSGLFTIDEVKRLWASRSWSGKKSGDPLFVRGGYNCRHQWSYVNPNWYNKKGDLII